MAIIEDSSSPSGYRNDVTGRFAKAAVSAKTSSAGADGKSKPEKQQKSNSNLGAPLIVSALRLEFAGLNKHLAFRFDSVIKAMGGTPAEKRDAKIKTGNIDPKKGITDPEEKEPRDILGTLKNINPFGKGKNPLIRILAFGALALALGSDKLIPVLAKVLKWMKETFLPWISSMWTAISDYDYSAAFKKVGEFFTRIKNFFLSFDTNDDGLDLEEIKTGLKAGVGIMFDKLMASIGTGVKTLFSEYGVQITALFAGYVVSKMLLKSLLFGGFLPMGAGGPAGGAAMRVLGLAGVMVGGLYLLHNRVIDAYDEAVKDENGKIQNFDATEMIARMLTGPDNKEGKSWTGAFMSAWDEALMGAGVGLAGGLVTGGILSLPLAAVGFVTGGVLGIMGARMGEDKLNAELDVIDNKLKVMGDDISSTGNSIANFFSGIVNAAKAIVDDETTVAGAFNQATKGSGEELRYKLEKEIRKNNEKKSVIQTQLDFKSSINAYGPGSKAYIKAGGDIPSDVPNDNGVGFKTKGQVQLDMITANERLIIGGYNNANAALQIRSDQAMQTARNVNMQTQSDKITALNNRINEKIKLRDGRRTMPATKTRLAAEVAELEMQRAVAMGDLKNMQGQGGFSATVDAATYTAPTSDAFIQTAKLKIEAAEDLKLAELKAEMAKKIAAERAASVVPAHLQPSILDASTTTNIKKEGDSILTKLSSTPKHHTQLQLGASWTNYYGYPDNHR